MRARAMLWVALLTTPIFCAYTYYFTDNLTSINLANWWQNGTLTAGAGGLTSADANGGSLISKVAVPDGASEYEVRTVLTLAASGGTFVHYLRATADARSRPVSSGTYYAVELQNPTFNGAICTATLAFYRRVGGVTTLLGSGTVACRSGMAMRSVRMPDRAHVYFDQTYIGGFVDSSIAAGSPAIGVRGAPAGNTIAQVQLGPLDRVAPSPVSAPSVGTPIKANEVSLQWQGAPDDANGIGVWHYRMFRNGQWMGEAATAEFTDATVAPAST